MWFFLVAGKLGEAQTDSHSLQELGKPEERAAKTGRLLVWDVHHVGTHGPPSEGRYPHLSPG